MLTYQYGVRWACMRVIYLHKHNNTSTSEMGDGTRRKMGPGIRYMYLSEEQQAIPCPIRLPLWLTDSHHHCVLRRAPCAYFRHYPLNIYENCFCCSFIHFLASLCMRRRHQEEDVFGANPPKAESEWQSGRVAV